jgi:nucleotidyltransferase substrate binding protein (TIGR01987 family)
MKKDLKEIHLRIQKLKKAQNLFELYRKDMVTDRDKAGAVQAFEFCYELAWKTMKKFLEDRGQATGSPKDTFRKALEEQLIKDPELWFDFQEKRNLTVHTYEQACVDLVLKEFDVFSRELQLLIEKLEELL